MHLTFESHFDLPRGPVAGGGGWMTSGVTGSRTLPDNKEGEYYSDASVGADPFSVENGVLTITARPGENPEGLPFNSGMLTTYGTFSQRYGYFEMRARLPVGTGLWPAFWLLLDSGDWPPEIDVMEQPGKDPHVIYVGTHSAAGGPNVAAIRAIRVADTSRQFHVYGMNWQKNEMTWYFDGKPVFRRKTPADMHTPMHLLINLAVGRAGQLAWAADALDRVSSLLQSGLSAGLRPLKSWLFPFRHRRRRDTLGNAWVCAGFRYVGRRGYENDPSRRTTQ
jgi:beta-glucanase (GH16 family)